MGIAQRTELFFSFCNTVYLAQIEDQFVPLLQTLLFFLGVLMEIDPSQIHIGRTSNMLQLIKMKNEKLFHQKFPPSI